MSSLCSTAPDGSCPEEAVPSQPPSPAPAALPCCLREDRSLQAVAADIVSQVHRSFASDTASILLLDESGENLRILAHVGQPPGAVDRTARVPIWASISGVALRERRPLLLTGNLKGSALERLAIRGDMGSAIAAPIEFQCRVIGVLNAGRLAGKPAYTDDDARLLRGLAQQVGDVLERIPLRCRLAAPEAEAEGVGSEAPAPNAAEERPTIGAALRLLRETAPASLTFLCLPHPESGGADLHVSSPEPVAQPRMETLAGELAAELTRRLGRPFDPQAFSLHQYADSPAPGPAPASAITPPEIVAIAHGSGELGLLGYADRPDGARKGAGSQALEAVGRLLTAALHDAQLLEHTRRHLAGNSVISELSRQLAGVFRLEELQELVRQAALKICLGAEEARVCLLDDGGEIHPPPSPTGGAGPAASWPCRDMIDQAVAQGPTIYHAPQSAPAGEGEDDGLQSPSQATLVVPIVSSERPLGVLGVTSRRPAAFDSVNGHLLTTLASQAAAAIEKARLYGELRRQKRHMEAVIRHMADGLIVLDPDRRIVTLNPAAERMLGLEASEALGWSPDGQLPDPRFGTLARICRHQERSEVIQHPALLDVEMPEEEPEVVVDAPVPRVLKVLSSPIQATTGEVGGEIKVLHDVTRERELDQLKSDFISTVSHELRTPLFSIRGFVELILKGKVPDPAVQREFLTRVAQQANHLGAIVSDLLDASRLETGSVELTREQVDLAAVVGRALEKLESVARDREVTLVFEGSAGMPQVSGDARRLEQVVTNLVGNGIKFSHPGGQVQVRCEAGAGEVLVKVTDHGVGIPPEALPHLFTKFYQVDSSPTRRVGGTGLGLHISRRIVEAHGGHMSVESQVGQGSVFTFAIPIANEG